VPHKDETIPPGEEWYYEVDGRAHGPFRWSALEELLGCSGETAAEARIRKGKEGDWTPFRSVAASTRSTGMTAVAVSSDRQAASSEALLRRPEGFKSLIVRHWDIAAAVGVWLLLNVLFLLFWPEPYARERRYLGTLQSLVAEVDRLRSSSASGNEWQELAKKSHEQLDPIVRDLEKSANSSEPLRQQLLWSARDLAPKIIGPPDKERDERERRLKQYLESVNQALGR
jgi:hypothetical protein